MMSSDIDLTKCTNEDLSDHFNTHIKEIMLLVESYNPDDFDIEYASELLRKLMNYNPLDLLIKAHPTLWNYREQIRTTNKDFFLKEDLITKFNVRAHNRKVQSIDIEYIINKIKDTWFNFNEDEQGDIIKRIKYLLKIASAYRFNNKITG